MITCMIGGVKRQLRFTMTGMEMAEDRFGSMLNLSKCLMQKTKAAKAVNYLLSIELTCGGFPATHAWVATNLRAGQVEGCRRAVLTCLHNAMQGQLVRRDEGPVDLVLQELRLKEAEKRGGTTSRQIYGYGLVCGMSMAEMRDSEPGFIMDMFAVRNKYLAAILGGGGSLDKKKGRKRPDW